VSGHEDDRAIITATIVNAELLVCPLCDFYLHVPAVPVMNGIGEALGMSGTTLAMIHAEQEGKRAASNMRRHLRDHSPEEWLARLGLTRREVPA